MVLRGRRVCLRVGGGWGGGMWGAPKSKEGRLRLQGAVEELRCAKEPCICFLFLLAPLYLLLLLRNPFLGKLLQHFCLKGKIYFKIS